MYFGAIGGAGAVLSRFVKKLEIVAYEDLGTEAIRRLEVEGFPAIVVNDCHGGDLYQDGQKAVRAGGRMSGARREAWRADPARRGRRSRRRICARTRGGRCRSRW